MNDKPLPYLPLFVKDLFGDERLRSVSAGAAGVYLYLLCLFHLGDPYGAVSLPKKEASNSYFDKPERFLKTSLKLPPGFPDASLTLPPGKQNFPQGSKRLGTLAHKLSERLPYSYKKIFSALVELLGAGVLQVTEDYVFQKRMINDHVKRERYRTNGKASTSSWNRTLKELNIIKTAEVNSNNIRKGGSGGKQFADFSDEVRRAFPGKTKVELYGFIMSFGTQENNGKYRFETPGFDLLKAWNQYNDKKKTKVTA